MSYGTKTPSPETQYLFRILVIGRANAGKTTLLKRVCDMDDDRCGNAGDKKGSLLGFNEHYVSDINRPLIFKSHPTFIFHDSPGFESGSENQLKEVQDFIVKHANATNVKDQIHAIWFCFAPELSRPFLELENKFFMKRLAGDVPVIAIFTKFDDLLTQIWNMDMDDEANREVGLLELEEKFKTPLFRYKFPPKESIYLEDFYDDERNHQEKVKELIEKTVKCLDKPA